MYPQPDASLHCETTDMGLVWTIDIEILHYVCACVLIARTSGGMARLN